MKLHRFTRALYQWWWLVVVSVTVAGLASYVSARLSPRLYVSRAVLMVGQTLQNPNPSQSEISTGQALAQSYVDLVKREPVLKASLEALGLGWPWTDLKEMTSGRAIPGTQLLEISVTDTDPQRARVLADEIAHQLILQSPAGMEAQGEAERQFVLEEMQVLKANIEKSQEELHALDDAIAKSTSARQIEEARNKQVALQNQISGWQATYARLGTVLQRDTPNFLSVIEPAQLPRAPIGPSVELNVLMAALIGLALASGAVLVLALIDDSLKTSDDVRQLLNLNTLGSIPDIEGSDYPGQLIVIKQPRSPTAEAFRMLRTNLSSSSRGQLPRTLLITSPGPEEGKSLTAANLAVAMAQFGKRVILVDADLRRPTQHTIFEMNNQMGLSTALTDMRAGLDGILQSTLVENLRLLTSGPLPPNPAELLSSRRMAELIGLLRQSADVVIFDSPPTLVAADVPTLIPHMDQTLLVVNSGHTRQAMAQRCTEVLEAVKASVLGVVINRLPIRELGYSYHYYYAEDGKRHKRRAPVRLPVPILQPLKMSRAIPQAKSVAASVKQAMPAVSSTQAEAGPCIPQLGQTKPHKEIAAPVATRAVPKVAAARPKARVPGVARAHRGLAISSARSWTNQVRRMARGKGMSAVVLGVIALAALIVALAASLPRQPYLENNNLPTVAVAQPTAANTSIPIGIATTAKGVDVVERPTEVPQVNTRALAATATAVAGATATQIAINAAAAQQAIGFLNCETLDLDILESPPEITRVSSGAVEVEFTWRVRNKATSPYCKWGKEKQETKLIQAVDIGRQAGAGTPVTLKWVEDNEYNLSVKVQLGVGVHDIRWRLLLPKMTAPGGPIFSARAIVLAPTLTPTRAPVPTPTPCPEVVYPCRCRRECSGRTCTTVCDECYRQECK